MKSNGEMKKNWEQFWRYGQQLTLITIKTGLCDTKKTNALAFGKKI